MKCRNVLRTHLGLRIFSLLLLILTSDSQAYAAPGDLDSSFGGTGIVTTSIGPRRYDGASSVAVQADGKIVAAGFWAKANVHDNNYCNDTDFAVVRYHSDGTLDTSFGGSGKVTTAIGAFSSSAWSVAVQPNGKIVVAGQVCSSCAYSNCLGTDIAVVRYNANGSLDETFDEDGNGIVITDLGGPYDYVNSLIIQPDGRIVISGGNSPGRENGSFELVRYTSDGALDTSFNGTGMVSTPVVGFGGAQSLALQTDGKIVVAGSAYVGLVDSSDFAVARYHANGTLDTSFGGTGKVTTSIAPTNDDYATSVAVQSDGKIVVSGYGNQSASNADPDFQVVRYHANGTLDTSFGDAGKVITPIAGQDLAYSMALQTDGKIVIAGNSNWDFAVVRYKTDGTLDTSFGGTGKVTTAFAHDSAYSVAIQADGKIVIAGRSYSGGNNVFAVLRYEGGEKSSSCKPGELCFWSGVDEVTGEPVGSFLNWCPEGASCADDNRYDNNEYEVPDSEIELNNTVTFVINETSKHLVLYDKFDQKGICACFAPGQAENLQKYLMGSFNNKASSHKLVEAWNLPACCADMDLDGIPNDGDGSGVVGDKPCKWIEGQSGPIGGCDDNCIAVPNADQVTCGNATAGAACAEPRLTKQQLAPPPGAFVSVDINPKLGGLPEQPNWTPTVTNLNHEATIPYVVTYQLILIKAGTPLASLDEAPTSLFTQCGEYRGIAGPPSPTPQRKHLYYSNWQQATGGTVKFQIPQSVDRDAKYWWTIRARNGSGPAVIDNFQSVYIMPKARWKRAFISEPGSLSDTLLASLSFKLWEEANGAVCYSFPAGTQTGNDRIRWDLYDDVCRFERYLPKAQKEGPLKDGTWDPRRPKTKRYYTGCEDGKCSRQVDEYKRRRRVLDCKLPEEAEPWDIIEQVIDAFSCGYEIACMRYGIECAETDIEPGIFPILDPCAQLIKGIVTYDPDRPASEVEYCY